MGLAWMFETMERANDRQVERDAAAEGMVAPGLGVAGGTHRPWSKPRGPWVMRMSWEKLLFAHWRVDAGALRRLIPEGLELDTFDGEAWVGVVPFLMSGVRPRCLPGVPGASRFPELNVRTYVRHGGKPGVWFLSLDAASRLAVVGGRMGFHLNYQNAEMRCEVGADGWVEYESERLGDAGRGSIWRAAGRGGVDRGGVAGFAGRYRGVGEGFAARVGTLEHWLTERYCLYAADGDGRLYRGEIDHEPWALRRAEAEIGVNTMGGVCGLRFEGEPHVLYAERIDVVAWLAERV